MSEIEVEKPFPLRRHFLRRVVPGLVVFAVVAIAITAFGAVNLIQAIYLELAAARAETIVRSIGRVAPRAWDELLSNPSTIDVLTSPAGLQLHDAFQDEIHELRLSRLKVYSATGQVVFDTDAANIGQIPQDANLARVLAGEDRVLVAKDRPDGEQLYELYVARRDSEGRLQAVFELYETVTYLDRLLMDHLLLPVAVPAGLFLLLGLGLGQLVRRAQANIDAHTAAISALRRQLQTFVSDSAVLAARRSGDGRIVSQRVPCTVLYTDVRSFTGFAEENAPERVVDFLNRLMALQVEAVRLYGGDVDKMIGDALLARFEGEGAAAQAIRAGRHILEGVAAGSFPRGVGIGVFSGEVISGAIGPENRRDFTIIGDGVNVAARLCSAAADGELVTDRETARASAIAGFAGPEEITVKGRRQPLTVVRLVHRPSTSAIE